MEQQRYDELTLNHPLLVGFATTAAATLLFGVFGNVSTEKAFILSLAVAFVAGFVCRQLAIKIHPPPPEETLLDD